MKCATLLSANYRDTSFVMDHINELKLHVKVLWLGDNLKPVVNHLLHELDAKRTESFVGNRKKFVVLHWTPSEIIDTDIAFEQVTMPRCEDMKSSTETLCKYELTPILKYFSDQVRQIPLIYLSVLEFNFDAENQQFILNLYNNLTENAFSESVNDVARLDLRGMMQRNYENLQNDRDASQQIYNRVACEWMRNHPTTYKKWNKEEGKEQILIGGIFPISRNMVGYKGQYVELVDELSPLTSCISLRWQV